MSDPIETQGKTVEEAIAEACLQLGLRRDEVDVRTVQEPKSGLLGFIGSRPAKVRVRKKLERHRGRGRDNRSGGSDAHSLGSGSGGRSRGGRGRGGRGRGGRDGQSNEQNNTETVTALGGPRNNERGNEGNKEHNNERNNDSGGRGNRSRGGRGRGRGRGRDQQQQESRYDGRNRPRDEAASGSTGGPAASTANAPSSSSSSSPKPSSAPRDSRRDEQGGDSDQRRSRRGSRGGRGRSRRNNPEHTSPVNEADVVRTEERAPRPAAVVPATESPVVAPAPVETAPVVATPVEAAPVVSTPEPAPVVKKKKRSGWGGGLGSRLKSQSDTPTKETPTAAELAAKRPAPELTAPAPTPTPETSEGRAPRQDRAPSSDRAPRQQEDYSRRPSDEIDEVIISDVKATKYASAVTGVTEETLDATLDEMTNGVLARAGFSCEVSVTEGEYRQVRITSDDESAGLLIGRHGQTVDAVEHLIERMVSNSVDDRVRMNLDINEYRERRQEDLAARVADAVAQVRETGRAQHMESMSARERRLVHLEAENLEGIRTFTMSGNGGKHVVIAEDDEKQGDENQDDDRHDG